MSPVGASGPPGGTVGECVRKLYRHCSQNSAIPSRGVPHCGHGSATAVASGPMSKPGGDGDDGGVEAGEAADEELDAGRDP